jgi:hypothetical protein
LKLDALHRPTAHEGHPASAEARIDGSRRASHDASVAGGGRQDPSGWRRVGGGGSQDASAGANKPKDTSEKSKDTLGPSALLAPGLPPSSGGVGGDCGAARVSVSSLGGAAGAAPPQTGYVLGYGFYLPPYGTAYRSALHTTRTRTRTRSHAEPWGNGGATCGAGTQFLSAPNVCLHQTFLQSFCMSQLPHESVNLSFTITDTENKFLSLCGNGLPTA